MLKKSYWISSDLPLTTVYYYILFKYYVKLIKVY